MTGKKRFPSVFPGWWIVLTGCFMNLWGAGYYLYGFSALFKPIASQLGFTRATTSVAGSIGRVGGGLLSPVVGWLTDRFGPKWVIMFGIGLFGLGLILMNFIQSLWSFYVVWGVMVATGFSIAAVLPLDKALANWFVRKRGLALGVRWVFSGVLVLPLITWLITTQGWRAASVTGGVVMLVVGWTLGWFFVKQHRPEHYGLLPDGARVDDADGADTGQLIDRGIEYAAGFHEVEFTLRQAMRTPAYWLMLAGMAIHGTVMASVMTHTIPLLTDMGIDPTAAATMMMVTGIVSTGSRFGTGLLVDRVGKGSLRVMMTTTYVIQGGGIAFLVANPTESAVYPFLILFYVGMGATMVLMSILSGRYFGRKAFGSIRGSIMIISMPLVMLGPVYAGWVYDSTGDYLPALTLFAWMFVAAAVLMFLARPPKTPRQITGISDIV